MKKLPFILGIATATAGAFAGAMVSLDAASALTQDNEQPNEQQPVETKKQIDSLIINDIADQTYTGEAITPPVYILDAQKQLTLGTDYSLTFENNINVGIADVLITGKGQYDGTQTIHFNILKRQNSWIQEPDLENSSLGQAQFGTVTRMLVGLAGSDEFIELLYDEEVNDFVCAPEDERLYSTIYIGGNTITVKYIVDESATYTGLEKVFTFTIPHFAYGPSLPPVEYTGEPLTPGVEFFDAYTNERLVEGVDYTLSYTNNTDIGTATVTITFIGLYAEVEPQTRTFNIVQAAQVLDYQFDNGKIVKYTGSEQEVTLPTSYSIGELKTIILQSGSIDLTEEYDQNYNDALNYYGMNEEEARQYAEEQLQYSWQINELDYALFDYYESDYSNIRLNKTWNGKIVNWSITGEKQEYIVGNDIQVTSVGSNAFAYNQTIHTLNVGNNITSVEPYAFANMMNLQRFNLPQNLTPSIGMFSGSITQSLTVPSTWTEIPAECFSYCLMPAVFIGNNVTEVGRSAFTHCEFLTLVQIGENVTEIDDYAFESCSRLSSITLPQNLLSIGDCAFARTNIEAIVIPAGVSDIGGVNSTPAFGGRAEGAFVDCANLKRVTLLNTSQVVSLGYCAQGSSKFLGAFGINSWQPYDELVIYVPQSLQSDYNLQYNQFSTIVEFKVIGDTSVNVSITSSNSSAGTVTSINSVGAIDDVITFSATANSGYYFSHWVKNGSTMIYDDTVTITLTGKDVSYAAYFVAGSKETVNGYNITANGGVISVGADSITITAIDTANFVYWKYGNRNLGEQSTLTIPFSEIYSDMIIIASDGFIQETIIDFSSEYDSSYYDLISNGKTAEEATTLTQDYMNQLYGPNGSSLVYYIGIDSWMYDNLTYVCNFDWTNKTVTVTAYGKVNGYY